MFDKVGREKNSIKQYLHMKMNETVSYYWKIDSKWNENTNTQIIDQFFELLHMAANNRMDLLHL